MVEEMRKMEYHTYGAPVVNEEDDAYAFNSIHRLSTEPGDFGVGGWEASAMMGANTNVIEMDS
ncbi:hypothetical protein ACLOJK_004571 [Asimina triloba]